MESPPRPPPERRYPLRLNRADSRSRPRPLSPPSSSSSSSAPPSPPPTGFGRARALAFAPPPPSPPASNRHRASSSAALDAATDEAVSPISSEGPTVSLSDVPLKIKIKQGKKKEVKETLEPRPRAEKTCTSRVPKDVQDTNRKARTKGMNEKEVKETIEPTSSRSRVAGIRSNHAAVEEHENFIRIDAKELSDALNKHGVSDAAVGDHKNLIIIDTEDLNHALDTHGVSYAEKTNIFNNLVDKCNGILKETVATERGRCRVLINKISDLTDKYFPLCHVLGEPEKVSDIQMSASLKQMESFLVSAVTELEDMKFQRLKKLQEMQGNMIDLWDRLGITIAKQRPYSFMMCHCTALLDEVVKPNALSLELLQKVEQEVERLKMLLKKAVTKNLTVLNGNLEKAHLFGDKEYAVKFTIADIDEGNTDIFLAYDRVKELIEKSSTELADRETIVVQAERVFNAGNGEKTSKYQGRDDVCDCREKVKAWETQHGRAFLYDGDLLVGKLERVADDDQELGGTSSTGGAAAAPAETCSDSETSYSESDHSSEDPEFIPSESEDEV